MPHAKGRVPHADGGIGLESWLPISTNRAPAIEAVSSLHAYRDVMRRVMIMLVSMVMLLACTETPPPPSAPLRVEKETPASAAPVVTDRDRYVMSEGPYGPETTIVTTFTAPADRPVNLLNCNGAFPIGLQRLTEGDKWVDQWAAEMNACASAPIVIPPGGRHTRAMTVESGVDAEVDSRMTGTNIGTGTYRVVWYAAEGLPLEQRVSGPFAIEAAPPRDRSQPSPLQRPAEIAAVEPAHGARVPADAPVRIRFSTAIRSDDVPHLYVDRVWAGEELRSSGSADALELEYKPSRRWKPGRHDVRVVYQDRQGQTRWYAWSFIVGE